MIPLFILLSIFSQVTIEEDLGPGPLGAGIFRSDVFSVTRSFTYLPSPHELFHVTRVLTATGHIFQTTHTFVAGDIIRTSSGLWYLEDVSGVSEWIKIGAVSDQVDQLHVFFTIQSSSSGFVVDASNVLAANQSIEVVKNIEMSGGFNVAPSFKSVVAEATKNVKFRGYDPFSWFPVGAEGTAHLIIVSPTP